MAAGSDDGSGTRNLSFERPVGMAAPWKKLG